MSVFRNLLFDYSINPYKYVEYIESDGNQYINTKINGGSNINTYIDMQFINYNNNTSIFGSRNKDFKNRYSFFTYMYNELYYYTWDTGWGYYRETGLGKRHVWHNIGYIFYRDNEKVITANNTTFKNNMPVYIFAINDNGIAAEKSSIKLYSFKMYKDNILVRDYVPCYRTLDKKTGLYDLVTKEFYENLGTKEFKLGPEI